MRDVLARINNIIRLDHGSCAHLFHIEKYTDCSCTLSNSLSLMFDRSVARCTCNEWSGGHEQWHIRLTFQLVDFIIIHILFIKFSSITSSPSTGESCRSLSASYVFFLRFVVVCQSNEKREKNIICEKATKQQQQKNWSTFFFITSAPTLHTPVERLFGRRLRWIIACVACPPRLSFSFSFSTEIKINKLINRHSIFFPLNLINKIYMNNTYLYLLRFDSFSVTQSHRCWWSEFLCFDRSYCQRWQTMTQPVLITDAILYLSMTSLLHVKHQFISFR